MNNFTPPSKKDFLDNPESRPIWKKCVEILEKAKELNTPEGDEILIRAKLIGKKRELENLGLISNMNLNLEKKAYENPVTTVKYVAGQVLSLLERGITSTNEALGSRNFDKNKISEDSEAIIIGEGESSPEMDKIMIDQQMISTLEMFLDSEKKSSPDFNLN